MYRNIKKNLNDNIMGQIIRKTGELKEEDKEGENKKNLDNMHKDVQQGKKGTPNFNQHDNNNNNIETISVNFTEIVLLLEDNDATESVSKAALSDWREATRIAEAAKEATEKAEADVGIASEVRNLAAKVLEESRAKHRAALQELVAAVIGKQTLRELRRVKIVVVGEREEEEEYQEKEEEEEEEERDGEKELAEEEACSWVVEAATRETLASYKWMEALERMTEALKKETEALMKATNAYEDAIVAIEKLREKREEIWRLARKRKWGEEEGGEERAKRARIE